MLTSFLLDMFSLCSLMFLFVSDCEAPYWSYLMWLSSFLFFSWFVFHSVLWFSLWYSFLLVIVFVFGVLESWYIFQEWLEKLDWSHVGGILHTRWMLVDRSQFKHCRDQFICGVIRIKWLLIHSHTDIAACQKNLLHETRVLLLIFELKENWCTWWWRNCLPFKLFIYGTKLHFLTI